MTVGFLTCRYINFISNKLLTKPHKICPLILLSDNLTWNNFPATNISVTSRKTNFISSLSQLPTCLSILRTDF